MNGWRLRQASFKAKHVHGGAAGLPHDQQSLWRDDYRRLRLDSSGSAGFRWAGWSQNSSAAPERGTRILRVDHGRDAHPVSGVICCMPE